ncbi:carbon-nitrogen hydrolase family protein [Gordonia sp. CPCC 205515]|uniref:carbon-nitrogen hydrolase family protein n=1 Tax=Gordonia sp. CPCC 205515 TaxID=3140791 RepID=UPI003AF4060D
MTADLSKLRIALMQCISQPDDVAGNLTRLAAAAASIAELGARLLITPEMMVSGYNIGADGAHRLADPVDGPIAQRLAAIAREHRLAILYGCPEIDDSGVVYNAIRLVDATGETVATHHKTHLYGDLDRSMVAAGDIAPPVVDLDGWRLGLATCYEVEFPEVVRSLAVRDADVICVPTANMVEFDAVQRILLPARAVESQVFVAYANYCGVEGELTYGGLSEVVAPTGEILAIADRAPEILVVDLDRALLEVSRLGNPYLADRRPDLY